MIASLGFDTIIVNNHDYSDSDLLLLFELFAPLDIKNFIFLFDFDLSSGVFSFHTDKLKEFKRRASNISLHAAFIYFLSVI